MAEKGKVVKVYSLTPFGEEIAKIAKDFERRIRIDALEELRVMIIRRIETRPEEFFKLKKGARTLTLKEDIADHNGAIAAYHEVIDMIAAAKKRVAHDEPRMSKTNLDAAVKEATEEQKVQAMMRSSGIKDPKAAKAYYSIEKNADRGDWIK